MNTDDRARVLAASDAFLHAPVAYSILDLAGQQLAANPAFHDLFRTDRQPIRIEDITHPGDMARTASYLDALISGERDRVVVDKRYLRADGSVFWGRLTASALLDGDGRPEMLLGVIEDITPQMETLAQLTAVSEAKSAFVARVSHDLRAPLHAISGLAELLTIGERESHDQTFAKAITKEAEALRSLVDDLLDLSRVEAGRIDLNPAPFSLSTAVEGSVELLRYRADERGLDLELTIAAELVDEVWGDSDRLRQILVNLIDNALKFTPPCGSVHVEVAPGGGDETVISVSDTGAGITSEDLDHIFKPFAQSHENQTGTGLGLTISRDLASAMGGSLTVESAVGHGSTFTLRLPLPRASSQAAPDVPDLPDLPEDAAPVGATDRPMVLVVEDSPVNRLLVASQLDQLGYRHTLAADGHEALEAIAETEFALVFMDWHLPDIDGLETTRRLRALENRTGRTPVPVVAVTARAMSNDRQRCLDAGMNDFLAKPAGLGDLDRMLRTWIPTAIDEQAPVRPAAPLPVLGDVEAVERLVDELGDGAIVATLVRTFLAELPSRRDAIVEGAAGGDLQQVRRAAHTLKSTSRALGASVLADLATELEQRAMADGAGMDELIHRLDADAAAAAAGFSKIIERLERR